MSSISRTSSHNFDSNNTLGIAPVDGDSFYVAYISDSNSLRVKLMQKGTDGKYDKISLPHPGHHASMSPALVIYRGDLYLFYRENEHSGHDKQFYYQKFIPNDGSLVKGSWSSKTKPNNVKGSSDHNPVVIDFHNQIWLVDKNNVHHLIAEAWMHKSEHWHTNKNVTYWDSEGNGKEDWGYQNNPKDQKNGGKKMQADQILTVDGGNPCTPRNPSMTVKGRKLYMAFKGGRQTSDSKDAKMYIMKADTDHNWTKPVHLLKDNKSKFAPSLTVCGNSIICVFSNDDHHDHLYFSTSTDGATWSSPVKINDDKLINGKATDPFVMALDDTTFALSYVEDTGRDKKATLKIFSFTA